MIINNASKMYGNYQLQKVKSVSKASKTEFSKDILAISDTAKDFNKIRAEVSKTPDVRQDRVDELKARIQAGNYFVKSEDIAAKILEA